MVARGLTLAFAATLVVGCLSAAPAGETPAGSLSPSVSLSASALPTIGSPAPVTLVPSVAPVDTPTTTTAPPPPTPSPSPRRTRRPSPTPEPTPRPAAIRTFAAATPTVDCNVEPQPTQIRLEWEIARATGVTLSIDGPGVYESYEGPSGSADVPFSCGEPRHTYLLTTTGGEGAVASEEIVVRRARPEVLNFSANTLVLNGPCTQVHQRRLFWTVDHAIGVRISSGGQVLGEYNSREGSELFPYDCRNSPTVTYTIETTGAYGPHATQTIEVGYQAPV